MSCLTDSLVDPPHLHLKSTGVYKTQVVGSETNHYFNIIPLQMKLLRKDSLLSLFSWAAKNEAGDFLHEHSVDDAIAHSVDPVVYRRVSNSKRGPSPPPHGPSPPPNLALSKLPSVLASSSRCNSESDVDRGVKKVDTNIDTGRDESVWLNLLLDDSVDGEFGPHYHHYMEVLKRPRSRRLDFGDSVDRKGSVESLSYPVDARASFTNASENSAQDWEPHEAESLLSQIYDLGDDCICLMHPCICNLDENSFPEPPPNKYAEGGRKSRAPRKQVSERIRQRELESMKAQQPGYAAVDRKDMDGTSTDSSSQHRDITQDRTQMTAKVTNKTRFPPYEQDGTNVDLGSRDEHAEWKSSDRDALLLNNPVGQEVDLKFRLETLGDPVHSHVTRVNSALSTSVDVGDNERSAQKCRENVLICTYSASNGADMAPAARVSPVDQSADGSMETDTAKSNHKLHDSMAAAESGFVVDATAVTSEQEVQATLVTPEPPYEVANDFVFLDSETPRMPDVMYDDFIGDGLEKPSQGHNYAYLPQVFDALCFAAQQARSTNVDDPMAADNGRYDQIFRCMSSGREPPFAEFLPGTDNHSEAVYGMAVDGSPGRPTPSRRCRSDPDMQGSKTDPCHCNMASFPSAKAFSKTSRIPKRVMTPRAKSSEPSEQEQKQMRSPMPLQRQSKSRKPQEQRAESARPIANKMRSY